MGHDIDGRLRCVKDGCGAYVLFLEIHKPFSQLQGPYQAWLAVHLIPFSQFQLSTQYVHLNNNKIVDLLVLHVIN